MRFQLLGQFKADADGKALGVRRRQERQLLAALLLHQGRPVAVASLVGLIWEDAPPRDAHRLIHCHLSRIRAALLSAGGNEVTIATGACSYTLRCAESTIDVFAFRDFIWRGLAATDPGERIGLLRRALDLWQAPILADFTGSRARAALCTPLEEQRLAAVDALFGAELERGGQHRVLAEVGPLLTEYPYHDRLVYYQMLALHRAGRAVEALRAYRNYWSDLRREMGLAPGRELETLQAQILRGGATGGSRATDPRWRRPTAHRHLRAS